MTDIADILQQIQDAVDVAGATVEVKDNDIIITFPDGTTQIFEGVAHLVGSGVSVYNDDMGSVIDLLDPQGVLPLVEFEYELGSISLDENGMVKQAEDCLIEVPVTPIDCDCEADVESIISNAFATGFATWLNTENPFDPIDGPWGTWNANDNDFIMTNSSFADGLDGDDFIFTPHHNTRFVIGHDGNDVILDLYSNGAKLIGGDGDDLVVSLFGENNILAGNEGNDTLIAFGYNNILDGGDGDDTLLTIGNNNKLFGGDGDDLLIAKESWGEYQSDGEGGNYLDGGDGDDCLFGADYVSDTLYGGEGNDYLDGGEVYGSYDSDELYGGDGDDTLIGRGDHHNTLAGSYDGGDGFDRLDLSNVGNNFETWDFDNVSNIEMLDMEDGDGDDTMYLNPWDVIGMTDNDNELFIIGDEGDKLYLTGLYEEEQSQYRDGPIEDWTKVDCDCEGTDDNSYDTYTLAGATLYVDTDITVMYDVV